MRLDLEVDDFHQSGVGTRDQSKFGERCVDELTKYALYSDVESKYVPTTSIMHRILMRLETNVYF
jgi:hypothetical protein